ncbi:MAG: FN3 associated domain-containing protein [Oscillospiraceae bacterium]|nr:FN3 associated domain-containing protein [Oscillospiraceae bacterium]
MKIRKGMAKILSTFMAAAIAVSAFAGTTLTASAKSKWDGWLKISSAGDLLRMNNSEGKFYLTKDIDLKDDLWQEELVFNGTLDGNGYCIKNLTSTKYGLFYSLGNATIQNIGLYNVKIKSGYSFTIGGFASRAYGTTFTNCYVTGEIESDTYSVAGFTGELYRSTPNKYVNCVNMANVTGSWSAAGIECADSSGSYSGSTYENCINFGKIEGRGCVTSSHYTYYVAGICHSLDAKMTSCFNAGKIVNKEADEGIIYNPAGLTGYASSNAFMTNCGTTTKVDISNAASNCMAQGTTSMAASKLTKSSTFKGYKFGTTWTIDKDINKGRPVLSTMLKHYSGSKPTASVKTGTAVAKGTKIELSTDIKGGVIRYTTNGKTPGTGSKKFTDGITIIKNTTIKAAVFVNGYRAYVVTLKYTVK